MKTRIISAAVGTVVLLLVLFCPWTWVFTAAAAALAAVAVWELAHNTGAVKSRLFILGSMVFAAAGTVLMTVQWRYTLLLAGGYGLFAMLTMLARHDKVSVSAGCFGAMMTLYVTLGFGSVAALREFDGATIGLWNILLLLVIPFMSDTGAYFIGTFFGKHRMAPVISPKKSWEGFFGGWLVSVGCAALLAVIAGAFSIKADPLTFALIAAVLAPISVCGDLLASVIKRQYGIKDYGNIMPGHGGVMDRFDSVLMIAPLLYGMAFFWGTITYVLSLL